MVVKRRQHDNDKAAHYAGVGVAGEVPVSIRPQFPLQPGLAFTPLESILLLLPFTGLYGQLLAELDDEAVLILPAVGGGKLLADAVGVGLQADLGIGC
ncbi:hypothetical protein D3C76_1640360 [compost metagenome]